jgi:hypothetical protein
VTITAFVYPGVEGRGSALDGDGDRHRARQYGANDIADVIATVRETPVEKRGHFLGRSRFFALRTGAANIDRSVFKLAPGGTISPRHHRASMSSRHDNQRVVGPIRRSDVVNFAMHDGL